MTVKWSQTVLPVKYDGSISHESIPIIYTGTLAVCDVFSSNSQYTTLLNSVFRKTAQMTLQVIHRMVLFDRSYTIYY